MRKSFTITFSTVFLLITAKINAQNNFVTVSGNQMMLSGKAYHYIGTNYWYGTFLEAVNGAEGKLRLKKELDFMKSKGITNLRVLAGAEGVAVYQQRVPYAMQPEQSKYDEKYLRSLDYLLDELGKRNMKGVLFLTNNWDWSGGITEYLRWNGYGAPPAPKGYGATGNNGDHYWDDLKKYTAQFYTCKPCQTALNNYIHVVLTRKNTINGKAYVNDPSIMAWEIANEPRPMVMANLAAFQTWISNTTAYIKSIDKNHLLTTGSEGDIAYDGNMNAYIATHSDKNIDYLTIHIWPKNWEWFKDTSIVKSFPNITSNTNAYLAKHIQVAQKLNKPLVIEEFGLPRDKHLFAQGTTTNARDRYYQLMFDALLQSVSQKGAIAGVNFWGFGGVAKTHPEGKIWKIGDDFTCDPGTEEQGLNSVFAGDQSTWKVVQAGVSKLTP